MKDCITRNIAFFDAEYTALNEKDRGIQEMIQCAFVVYKIELSDDQKLVSMSNEPIFIYNTFVRPVYNRTLSPYIKKLTGIEQEDVDTGKLFVDALNDLCSVVDKYKVGDILTWGPDRMVLKKNCDVLDCCNKKTRKLLDKFSDVSEALSDLLGYEAILSQHRVCELLLIAEIGDLHDAYCDATNLSKIIKSFIGIDVRQLFGH